jgi:hypothetical protein
MPQRRSPVGEAFSPRGADRGLCSLRSMDVGGRAHRHGLAPAWQL